jgi:hypothetical protein
VFSIVQSRIAWPLLATASVVLATGMAILGTVTLYTQHD